jgi:hypothetical protein
MPDNNSVKALRKDIERLKAELHSLQNDVRHHDNEFHELLRNAPWQHHDHSAGPQQQTDQDGETSPRQTATIHPVGIQRTQQAKNAGSIGRPWLRSIWKRGFGVLVGLAGIAYAIINYEQWRDADRNFRTDQRAWIEIDKSQHISIPLPSLLYVGLPADMVNRGKTPAMRITAKSNAQVLSISDEPFLTYDSPSAVVTTIPILFQGSSMPFTVGTLVQMSADQRNGLENQRLYIVAWSSVTWLDVFGQHHWLQSCQWYLPPNPGMAPGSPVVPPIGLPTKGCSDYNGTDAGQ